MPLIESKKRIALLVPNFVEFDGAARIAEVQAMDLLKEGHKVDIFTFASGIDVPGADIYVMKMPKSLFWERIYRLIYPLDIYKVLKWLPKLKGYDEVIAHLYPLTFLAWLAKKRYGLKYTFWYHGIMPPRLFPHLYERVYMRLQILLTRLTVSNADRAVAVSNYGHKELKKYTGLDSEVIYNTTDLSKFHPGVDGSAMRKQYNLGDSPVILFVGALRPVKGVDLLLEAYYIIKKEIRDVKLIIVGKPDFPYYYEVLKRNSDDSVIYAGFVSHDHLPEYYGACDIYASCTLWEIHNVSSIEAQACGKPVIVWHESFEVLDENSVMVKEGDVQAFAKACIEKIQKSRAG